MLILSNFFSDSIWPALLLLISGIAPLVVFTWIIHFLEWFMQQRLSRRFGWNSVMLTGWLGTPIHELSHALMCGIFQHKIIDMALFQPDKKAGRLGYVTHTYTRGNLFQEIGTFFIGIAPLIGGTAVLLALLMLFFPDVGRASLFTSTSDLSLWEQTQNSLQGLFSGLFQSSNLANWKLWTFLYLVICVGSHMAPSTSDYQGAKKGATLVLLGLVVVSILVVMTGSGTNATLEFLTPILAPIITALIAVVILVAIATVFVFLVTELYDLIRRR